MPKGWIIDIVLIIVGVVLGLFVFKFLEPTVAKITRGGK